MCSKNGLLKCCDSNTVVNVRVISKIYATFLTKTSSYNSPPSDSCFRFKIHRLHTVLQTASQCPVTSLRSSLPLMIIMNAKEELMFVKQDDMNSLDGDPVSPASDQLELDDVIANNGVKRKRESPDVDDTDSGALSPRKQLQIAQHHNNNDVSFVLIDDDGGGGTGPEDLASGDEEVSHMVLSPSLIN